MENPTPEKETKKEKSEKKLSRTTLTFYIVGLFSLAIALIMISYVAQAKADRQLENLSTKLSEQQTVAQGISQKMADLQAQFDVVNRALDAVREKLACERAKTDIVGASQQRMEERDVYAQLTQISASLLAENIEEAETRLNNLQEIYGEERLNGTAEQDAFTEDIPQLYENLRQRLETLRAQQTLETDETEESDEQNQMEEEPEGV